MAVAMACGGMEPSEAIVQDNLHEAPASAHTVSTSDITIKSWFDVTPPKNSATWILSDGELDAVRASRGSPETPPDGVFIETIS